MPPALGEPNTAFLGFDRTQSMYSRRFFTGTFGATAKANSYSMTCDTGMKSATGSNPVCFQTAGPMTIVAMFVMSNVKPSGGARRTS